ncbi:MAG: GDSL-type esterase/lipase family protein [Balneolaceae bacterium]
MRLVFLFSCLFVGCNQITDAPNDPAVDESLAPIFQIADTVKVRQGEEAEIIISDFFESEVPIISVEFDSEEERILVDAIGDGRFSLSQPDDLSGEFRIRAIVTNRENSTLEAELLYLIEEETQNPDPDPTPAPTPTGEALVIMPLGDSMTNDSRPRVKLWEMLTDIGYELDYVGNQSQESSIPDPDHEGVGGITIEGIMDKAESLMQRHNPDYVALMVGTNDIAWYFDETAQEMALRWTDLIDRIIESSEPGTYILAATIPPVSSRNVGKSDMSVRDRAIMVQRYNAELRSIIEDRKENGDSIILADMEAAMDSDRHLSGDGVHLNEAGYAIMGETYYEAMIQALNEQE